MNSKKFKVGDLVQLKSGGPLMTVCGVSVEGALPVWVACVWFFCTDTENTWTGPVSQNFDPRVLREVGNDPKGIPETP